MEDSAVHAIYRNFLYLDQAYSLGRVLSIENGNGLSENSIGKMGALDLAFTVAEL